MGGEFLLAAIAPDDRSGIDERHGEIFRERYLDRMRAFPKTRELVLRVDRRHVIRRARRDGAGIAAIPRRLPCGRGRGGVEVFVDPADLLARWSQTSLG